MNIMHIVLSSGADYTDNLGYQENTLPIRHSEMGHSVTVISSTTSSLSEERRQHVEGQYYIDSVKIIRLKPTFKALKNRYEIFANLYDIIEKEQPDLIFSHGFTYLSLTSVKRYKKAHPNVVVFFDCHATYENSFNRFPIIQKFISNIFWVPFFDRNKDVFDKGYYIAPQVKTFLCDRYNMNGIELTHLPLGTKVPEELLNERNRIKTEWRKRYGVNTKYVIITGGRFRESKKLFELLNAVKQINSSDFTLFVFGRFEDDEYYKKCAPFFDDDLIRNIGWLTNEETIDSFLAADLGVFSGSQSVLWRTAIATGLPIVCRYSDGAEELDRGGNCQLMNTDSPEEWAMVIEGLLNDETKLFQMKIVAETEGRGFFSEDRIAKTIIDDYIRFKLR